MPAVVAVAQQGIDAIGAYTHVQRAYRGAARDRAAIALGEQVGKKVQVIGTPRDWRAQIVGRDVPVIDPVQGLEQRPVEHLDRSRVGEVDAFLAVGVDDHVLAQFRAAFDQLREVVTALVAVARVQGGFAWIGHDSGVSGRTHRGQARSYKGRCITLWERACPRWHY
ncbi:hypothetical protein D3C80_1248950 [compost metagenome]